MEHVAPVKRSSAKESSLGLGEGKRHLRNQARIARDTLSIVDRERFDREIFRQLISHQAIRDAAVLVGYRAFGAEVNIDEVLARLLQSGCRILLPRVKSREIVELCEVESLADRFRPGAFGIAEPEGPAVKEAPPVEVLLAPGIAFDRRGGRLGFGRGYFDRLIAKMPSDMLRFGIAYSCQLVDEIPLEPWDELMDAIITEDGLIRTGARDIPKNK